MADNLSTLVCNCGPLIALAGIDQLSLLPHLFNTIWVPEVVHRELTGSRRFAQSNSMFVQPWLKLRNPAMPSDAFLSAQLDPGEVSVITLARELREAEVLIDERKARRVAERVYGLRILGTGGLLLRAKVSGLIPCVRPLLNKMRKNGYHLSDRLLEAVCQATGE